MGFKRFSKYRNVNFSILDSFIPDEKKQEEYYNNLYNKFLNDFKVAKDIDFILWDLRIQKSLKEIYTSASLYTESNLALENKYMTSYYFLSYYSLFHAFLSVLYLDRTMTLKQLIEMPHDKVKKNFISLYSNGKRKIISSEIKNEFELLKFYREYYSYSMPFNEFFSDIKNLKTPMQFLEKRLIHCFQIACLLSNIIENSSRKYNNGSGSFTKNNIETFKLYFDKINGKPNPFKNNEYLLDPSDIYMRKDFYKNHGGEIYCFSIHLEHFMDEFGMYESEYNNPEITVKANKFVYSSISK